MPPETDFESSQRSAAVRPVTLAEWGVVILGGVGLALALRHALLQDQGLTGGDTWPYFMPQKMVLAEAFADGRIPLWHDLTGLGYPLLAESQAGVFYPSNQVLYRLLDPARAYYGSIVLHYSLAFVFCWRFARCQQLSTATALLAALVYVYGWFPARISLEWSIIGGVWLPLTLWQTHEFLKRPSGWRFALLATCLGTHLLAGHFTLAFINQLTLIGYALLQRLFRPVSHRPKWTAVAVIPAAVLTGLLLGCLQLIPSMELKRISQRDGVTEFFDLGYGHLPPLYLTQLVASWTWWHTAEIRSSGQMQRLPGSIDSDTNVVEAHFYLGLIPLLLVSSTFLPGIARRIPAPPRRCWQLMAAVSLVYATGHLLPVSRHLPGFSWFMGPGRYTIVAALAGALLSSLALETIVRRPVLRILTVMLIGGLTWVDLGWSARPIADAEQVSAIWPHREQSWVLDYFRRQPARSCRLLASGPNVANLFDVSCVPQYLGLGPAVYNSDAFDLETIPGKNIFPSPEQMVKLWTLGVTHIFTTERVSHPADQLRLVAAQPDALLNRIWGRGRQSCFLYELSEISGRLSSEPATALAGWTCIRDTPEDIEFEVQLSEIAIVRLKELMYPGWHVTVDGRPATRVSDDQLHRVVSVEAGHHNLRWQFSPSSFRVGSWTSAVSLCLLWTIAAFGMRLRNPVEKHP